MLHRLQLAVQMSEVRPQLISRVYVPTAYTIDMRLQHGLPFANRTSHSQSLFDFVVPLAHVHHLAIRAQVFQNWADQDRYFPALYKRRVRRNTLFPQLLVCELYLLQVRARTAGGASDVALIVIPY